MNLLKEKRMKECLYWRIDMGILNNLSATNWLGAGTVLLSTVATAWNALGQYASEKLLTMLEQPFDLARERTPQVQYFRMETQYVHIGPDGKRTGIENYNLKLKCIPKALSGKSGDEYICGGLKLQNNDDPPVSIPSLKGWTYVLNMPSPGKNENEPFLGIPHEKFEDIRDSRGHKLDSYGVYANFVDFHAPLNDFFPRSISWGKGIQDIKRIGEKILHASAFQTAPIDLGKGIKPGSSFRNGEVTLEFKGLSIADGSVCAIIGYDSGEGTLKMLMSIGPDIEMVTVGGSQFKGDIYIDLATRWVKKATMDECVITETRMPTPIPKISAYTVRHILMRMIGKKEYER
jgi:hypothetical protein